MVTVLIPTFKRPELLRTALDSVSKQTYKQHISKVIVSENGLDDGSRALCDEFQDLNIVYVYQEKQLPHLQHWAWLISQVQDGYSAFLCDDDWWNIYHIEIALKSLEKYPQAISYFSNFSYASDEYKIKFVNYDHAKFMSFENAVPNNYDLKLFDKSDIFLRSFVFTPFHFSAVVCQSAALTEAVDIFEQVHQTYADRTLWAVLSTYGNLLFNPLPTTIIRYHPGQDSNNFTSDEWQRYNQSGSMLILELSKEFGLRIKERINELYRVGSVHEKHDLTNHLAGIFVDRNKIDWYDGYDDIIVADKQKLTAELREKSFKAVAKKKTLNFLRKFI